jgi:hypothetical protein
MLTRKIWDVGHLTSEDQFGHNDTKPNLGRLMTNDAYRDDGQKKEKRRRKIRRRMRRRVWHSKPHHHQREKPSKIDLVKMMTQASTTWMIRRWLSLSRDLTSSW